MSQPYDVGQVLYVIARKTNNIFPVMVIEEIVKRGMSSVKTQYWVSDGVEKTPQCLDDVAAEVFTSSEELAATLKKRAASAIDKRSKDAEALAGKLFQNQVKRQSIPLDSMHDHPVQDEQDTGDAVKVRLSDGTIANVKLNVNQT